LEVENKAEAERSEKQLRVNVALGALEMVFQPIVDLRTGSTVGAEALSRFLAPPVRPPDHWFAEAADVGRDVELEVAAVEAALQQLRKLPRGIYLSLNASPTTMVSPEFRSVIADVAAERVVLELTEHTGIDDYDSFKGAISQLRSQGLRLAIDDAGSGFSSFRHILNLRPDVIKLDITLTRGIDLDPARRALGAALLTFGLDAYNASMVAEGIETEGELNTLRALGCRYGQGFYLGKPGGMGLLDLGRLSPWRESGPSVKTVESQNGAEAVGNGEPLHSHADPVRLLAAVEEALGLPHEVSRTA